MTVASRPSTRPADFTLPLSPAALAELADRVHIDRHRVYRELRLDFEQVAAAEQAVHLVRDGKYPEGVG